MLESPTAHRTKYLEHGRGRHGNLWSQLTCIILVFYFDDWTYKPFCLSIVVRNILIAA